MNIEFLVIVLLILAFIVWPTYGVINGEITVRRTTIKRNDTPMYFWSMIGFLYFCAIVFPSIMWQAPFAGSFFPIMYIMFGLIVVSGIFKW